MGVAMNHKAKDKKYIEAGGLLLLLLLGIVGLQKIVRHKKIEVTTGLRVGSA